MIHKIAHSKFLTFMVCLLSFVVFYAIPNRLLLDHAQELSLTWLDQAIPLMAWTFVIYNLSMPWTFLPTLTIRSPGLRSRFIVDFLLISFIASLFFWIFPTKFPTDMWPAKGIGETKNFWEICVHFMRKTDNPINCFPSLHVAYAFLSAHYIRRNWKHQWITVASLTIAASISVATMTVKQHYFWDVLGGIFLFYSVRFFLSSRVHSFLFTVKKSDHTWMEHPIYQQIIHHWANQKTETIHAQLQSWKSEAAQTKQSQLLSFLFAIERHLKHHPLSSHEQKLIHLALKDRDDQLKALS